MPILCVMEDALEVYHRPHDSKHPLVGFDDGTKQQVKETRLPLLGQPGRTAKYERNGTSNLFIPVAVFPGERSAG